MAGLPPNPKCRLCGLWEGAKTVCMPGTGPANAEIMVIGEAPGAEEDRRGEPFVGRSGQLLRGELHKARLTEPFITNTVRCRPPDNRKPSNDEVKACRPYLDHEIATLQPKFIVTAGATPTKSVLKKAKITEAHGRMIPVPGFSEIVGMPMFHPAYALRDPSKLPMISADLQRLRRYEGGKIKQLATSWKLVTPANEKIFLRKFDEANEFSFDIETNQLFPFDSKGLITCLSIAINSIAYVIPWGRVSPERGPEPGDKTAREFFRRIFTTLVKMQARSGKWACGQNAKFDNLWLKAKLGVAFTLNFDTMLAHYTLDENSPHDLKYLARTYLDVEDYDLSSKEKRGFITPERLYEYGGKDAVYTLMLARLFRKLIQADQAMSKLFYHLTMPSARALEAIEARGIPLDLNFYAKIELETRIRHKAVQGELLAMVRKIRKPAPGKPSKAVNWNSPQQVSKFLFKEVGLRATVKTGTGADSTGEAALADLKGVHPVVDKLIEYRELEKFLSTYIGDDASDDEEASGWKAFIVAGRLFLGYKVHGTVTGRFSSRLHQIPRDGRIRNIATGYVDHLGRKWVFAQGDISQAELRIAGHISQDIQLITAYRRNIDVHWATLLDMIGSGNSPMYTQPALDTAEKLGNVLPEFLTDAIETMRKAGHEACIAIDPIWKEARKKAKAVNFGFIYGMYPNKFIETAKLKYGWTPTFQESSNIRERYFEVYSGLTKWHKRVKKLVAIDGYVVALSGRKRRLPGAFSSDNKLRMEAERQAINSPVQGFIGDYKAMCMIEIEDEIDHDEAVVCGEHHDALLMLIREDMVEIVGPKIKAIMKAPKLLKKFKIDLSIPMESDLEIGNWGKGTELSKWLKQRSEK